MRIMDFVLEEDHRRLLKLLKQFSYQKREVTLASGQKSDFYIDCKQTSFLGEGSILIGRLFYSHFKKIENSGAHFDACSGMALGAVPLTTALSMTAYFQGRELPALAVRKEVKDHGTKSTVEGALSVKPGAHILLLEDVVTTGGSTNLAADRLREHGFKVNTVLALVDRQAGGERNLKANNLSLCTLFDVADFADSAKEKQEQPCVR